MHIAHYCACSMTSIRCTEIPWEMYNLAKMSERMLECRMLLNMLQANSDNRIAEESNDLHCTIQCLN